MLRPEKIKIGYFSPDAVDLMRSLAAHGVAFLLVGGEAVIYYGHARLTGDLDLFYDRRGENPARLFAALHEFWGGAAPGIDRVEDLAAENTIVQFGRPPRRIDLLSSIDGVSFEQAWANSLPLEIEGEQISLRIIGLADLIANKRASHRPRDLEDLNFLEKIKP